MPHVSGAGGGSVGLRALMRRLGRLRSGVDDNRYLKLESLTPVVRCDGDGITLHGSYTCRGPDMSGFGLRGELGAFTRGF